MADELNIKTEKELKSWLNDKPAEWSQMIALRAALRVFPFVTGVIEGRTITKNQNQGLILQAWRAMFISSVAPKYPTDDMRRAAAAAVAASRAAAAAAAAAYISSATAAAASSANASNATFAASRANAAFVAAAAASSANASNAAFVASNAAADAASAADAADSYAASRAASAADAADSDAASRAASAASAAVWESISCDCRLLENDGSIKPETPLWLAIDPANALNNRTEFAIANPGLIVALMDSLTLLTDQLGPNAALIDAWYAPWFNGTEKLFEDKRGETLALKPNEFWKITDDRTADQIMDECAEVLGWSVKSDGETKSAVIPPAQGSGLQFEFRNGLIRLARGLGLGDKNDDQARIIAQVPILRDLVARLLSALDNDEMPRDELVNTLKSLQGVLSRNDESAISITELYTWSMVLRSQISAASTPAEGTNVFAFDGANRALAQSIATITDMITLGTEEGRKLFDDADRSSLDANELVKYKALEIELIDILIANSSILDAEDMELLKAAIMSGGTAPLPARSAYLSAASMQNVLIVFTGVGVLGTVAYSLIPFAIFGTAGLFIAKTIFGQSIKDSMLGKAFNKVIAKKIDKQTVEVFLQNKERLRKIADNRPSMQWLNDLLDELEKHLDDTNKK